MFHVFSLISDSDNDPDLNPVPTNGEAGKSKVLLFVVKIILPETSVMHFL